ncbi:MAG: hypothetical protein RMJ51_01250 [Candidatus Calescibacterium sp.]|nr:hypothetical protein [Candidatus Calescibacterium sp.]MCX7972168.1 hypothetical protein [bacterium]MDW8194857.1 hypothetical protein [Candidatus Calescibacterium sp.]
MEKIENTKQNIYQYQNRYSEKSPTETQSKNITSTQQKSQIETNIHNKYQKVQTQEQIIQQWEKSLGSEKSNQNNDSQGSILKDMGSYILDESKAQISETILSNSNSIAQKVTKKAKEIKQENISKVIQKSVKEGIQSLKDDVKDLAGNAKIQNPFENGIKQGSKKILREFSSEVVESGELQALKIGKESVKKIASGEVIKNTKQIASKGVEIIKTNGIKKGSLEITESLAKSGIKTISKVAGPLVATATAVIDYKDRLEEGKKPQRALLETTVSTAAGVLGGAAAGAALGSVVPGIGTVVGAVVGAGVAAFAADKAMDNLLGNWAKK